MKPEEFAKTLVKQYESHKGIFKVHKNAEDYVPKGRKKIKALFLFYVIQIDYAIKSQQLYEGALELFDEKPHFFDPEYILNLSDTKLRNSLKKYLKPRYVNEAVERYKINSQKLLDEYRGNPINIFKKTKTAKEALMKIHEFRGFGPKIGNFFLRTMVNVFEIEYEDIDDILPPVDIHDIRIAYILGYISSYKVNPKTIKEANKFWSKTAKKAGVKWTELDKALWLLGSQGRPKTKMDIKELLSA